MVRQPGFFDVEERLRELSAKGDELERIAVLVDFALFRAELERALPRLDGAKGGRPAFDHVLMFKILLLQQKGPMALVVRTIGIARARVKIGLANLALLWHK